MMRDEEAMLGTYTPVPVACLMIQSVFRIAEFLLH
jgi:hypothetical protein